LKMGWADWQTLFYQKACADNRISPVHISLYFALLHEAGHTLAIPFYLRRPEVMRKAKICSPVTLNRCLRELHVYGYIEYRPSYRPGRSMVGLIALSNEMV
jgi:hypothetical protein